MNTRSSTTLPHTNSPVATGSWDSSRQTIDKIIIHTACGSMESVKSWFANPNRENLTCAHYGIGLDGSIVQFLEESRTAYQAGSYIVNQQSCGIEHIDNGNPNDPRPDLLYQTSAKLVAEICGFYSIPIDRTHILKHSEVSKTGTSCPDALDVDRIVKMAAELSNSTTPQTTSSTASKTVSIDSTLFEQLVTKSHNFDVVGDVFGLTNSEKLDPKSGDRLAESIRQIKQDLIILNQKIDEYNRSQPIQATTTTTQIETSTITETNQNPPISTQRVFVLDQLLNNKDAGQSAKNTNLLAAFVSLRSILAAFWK